jgi:hypothetical protein
MTPETRVQLANLAGTFLLLVVFAMFVLASAALLLVVRALGIARRATPEQLSRVRAYAQEARRQAGRTATTMLTPQIRLTSAWIGVKAGIRALLAGSGSGSPAEGPEGADRRV